MREEQGRGREARASFSYAFSLTTAPLPICSPIHIRCEKESLVVGVYADNGSMDLVVRGNVFYAIGSNEHPSDAHAIGGNGYSYVNATNNIFVDCTNPFKLNDWFLESWGAANYPVFLARWHTLFDEANASGHLALYEDRYPELRHFFDDDHIRPRTDIFAKSLVYNPVVHRAAGNSSSKGFQCGSCPLSDASFVVEDRGYRSPRPKLPLLPLKSAARSLILPMFAPRARNVLCLGVADSIVIGVAHADGSGLCERWGDEFFSSCPPSDSSHPWLARDPV